MSEMSIIKATGPCENGYWVSPAGDVYELEEYQGHTYEAQKISSKLGLGLPDYNHMRTAGWCPIGMGYAGETVNFDIPMGASLKMKKALFRVIRWNKDSDFFVDSLGNCTALEAAREVRNA